MPSKVPSFPLGMLYQACESLNRHKPLSTCALFTEPRDVLASPGQGTYISKVVIIIKVVTLGACPEPQ